MPRSPRTRSPPAPTDLRDPRGQGLGAYGSVSKLIPGDKIQQDPVIASGVKQSQFIILRVYDVLGNEITTLVNEEKPAGEYELTFNGTELPSGMYFYKLNLGNYSETKKMILLK